MKDLSKIALNVATVLVSVAAVVMVGIRVQQRFFPKSAALPAPRTVDNWHTFARGGQRLGPSSAAVTIVEFGDFQCPFCKLAASDLRDIRAQFPGKVAVVFRQFPLPIHPFAAAAARASECAARQGTFEKYAEVLFDSQAAFGRTTWSEFAEEAGVPNAAAFQACLSDPSVGALVLKDAAAGERLGVTATPTFLINSLEVTGYPGKAKIEEFVRSALDGNSVALQH